MSRYRCLTRVVHFELGRSLVDYLRTDDLELSIVGDAIGIAADEHDIARYAERTILNANAGLGSEAIPHPPIFVAVLNHCGRLIRGEVLKDNRCHDAGLERLIPLGH